MPFNELLDCCRSRIPWPSMRQILKKNGLPVGQGWDGTIKKLNDFCKRGEEEAKKLNILEESYFEYLLCGERAVRLYQVREEKLKELLPALQAYRPRESIFKETFPFPLAENQLNEANGDTLLVHIEDDQESINLVFCTKRFVTERKELSIDELSSDAREDLRAYDEIIAIKHHMKQFFDVVTVRKADSYIEIRVDLNGGLSSDDIALASRNVARAFKLLCNELIGDEVLGSSVNLFPLVDKMYEASDGRVCELGFTTDGASIKLEKMRRKDICLRSEAYHRAGKVAVHHITPYRLGICWTVNISEDIETKPELLLPGNFRILSTQQQFLGDALISNCCGHTDFHFVVQKMKNYLNG